MNDAKYLISLVSDWLYRHSGEIFIGFVIASIVEVLNIWDVVVK